MGLCVQRNRMIAYPGRVVVTMVMPRPASRLRLSRKSAGWNGSRSVQENFQCSTDGKCGT